MMAPPVKQITGKFGRLTVLCPTKKRNHGHVLWLCRCDCGQQTEAIARHLKTGAKRSCGCRRGTWRHGHCRGTPSPTWCSWQGMRQRCSNPHLHAYQHYGGRGIKVCDRWHDFANFLADMGERPSGKTLDRIGPNGDYEPGNCRWATAKQQTRNRRSSKRRLPPLAAIEDYVRRMRGVHA